MKRSPSARRTLTGLLAVVLMAVAAATTVRAQTTLQAKLAARPLTTGDIAAYKLPSTTELSGGLATVGVGQAVYLEVQVNIAVPASEIASVTWELSNRPAGSNADLADSPLGPDVPIFEPSDRVVAQVAGRKLLRADVAGRYTVTATVSSVSAGVSTVSQTFTAGTYMGIKACGSCHGGGPAATKWSMADSWSKTLHSEIFKDGMNGVASDHYGPGCLGCHTVGYDVNPSAVNGGFDDVAAALKWVFPTALKIGTFDALPEALKNVGNIQCENCHGPGSQHVLSGGDTRMISVSFDSGACSQCHDAPTHHIKSAEWNNAMHAVTTRDPSGAGREACVGCHTGTGFVDRVNGVTTPNTAYTPINCQTCHEPHGRTNPATNTHLVRNLQAVTLKDGTKVTNAGAGGLCMNCHQSRQTRPSMPPLQPAARASARIMDRRPTCWRE